MSNLVTPYKYAKLKGISHQAVYQQIAAGKITPLKFPTPDGTEKMYIDLEVYPVDEKNKK